MRIVRRTLDARAEESVEFDPELREELVQLAAVATAWVESLPPSNPRPAFYQAISKLESKLRNLSDVGSSMASAPFGGHVHKPPDRPQGRPEAPQGDPSSAQWLRRKKMIEEGEKKFNEERILKEGYKQQVPIEDLPEYGADSGYCACCGDEEYDEEDE